MSSFWRCDHLFFPLFELCSDARCDLDTTNFTGAKSVGGICARLSSGKIVDEASDTFASLEGIERLTSLEMRCAVQTTSLELRVGQITSLEGIDTGQGFRASLISLRLSSLWLSLISLEEGLASGHVFADSLDSMEDLYGQMSLSLVDEKSVEEMDLVAGGG